MVPIFHFHDPRIKKEADTILYMSEPKTIEDTEYECLCSECQKDVGLDRPQFHGMVAFKGDYKTISCDKCNAVIV